MYVWKQFDNFDMFGTLFRSSLVCIVLPFIVYTVYKYVHASMLWMLKPTVVAIAFVSFLARLDDMCADERWLRYSHAVHLIANDNFEIVWPISWDALAMAIMFGLENILYDVQIQIIINYANMTRHDERVMHRLDSPTTQPADAHTHTHTRRETRHTNK